MLRKLRRKIKLFTQIRLFTYIYLNYFCKSVIRTDKSRIIPYKGAVIDIDPSAKIYLSKGDIEVGCDRLKGSKAETRVRLREKAVWSSEKGCRLSYGVTLEVLKNALLETRFFTMNSNTTLISAEKISLGNDVMIGRNVVIYDSDFHSILNQNGDVVNPSKPVVIGDHVWIGTNSTILKGTNLNKDTIIGADSTITKGNYQNTVTVDRKIMNLDEHRYWKR